MTLFKHLSQIIQQITVQENDFTGQSHRFKRKKITFLFAFYCNMYLLS